MKKNTNVEELDRMRSILERQNVRWTEKKMFGGVCFMVDGKMCFGTYKGGLMVRVDPDETHVLRKRKGAGPMMHGGKPMNGYLFLKTTGYASDSDLTFWIKKCLEFNPKAASSKK